MITLVLFTQAWLPAVQPWFRNPEVRRRLGGPEWPERELRLAAELDDAPFRGREVLRTHSWVGLDDTGEVVAKIGGDVYDRWTRYDGSVPEAPVISAVEPGPAMGISYVVAPDRWRQGIGRATMRALVEHPELADVRVFAAGIDVDNISSRSCAASAGFAPQSEEADWEGTIYYLLRRRPTV